MDHAPNQMKEQLLRFYCGGYNTLIDSALSWIEPINTKKWEAIDALEDGGLEAAEDEFMEIFSAWVLSACDAYIKSVKKDWIKDLVVRETMEMVMDDKAIEAV